jgi:cell division protein FtsL
MKVKTNPLEKKKPIRIIYWALIIFFLLLTLFLGRNSFYQVMMKKMELTKLQKTVNQLKAENDSLRKENHELKTNPEVIEKIAREQLGYQKSGEKVIRFLPASPADDEAKKKE